MSEVRVGGGGSLPRNANAFGDSALIPSHGLDHGKYVDLITRNLCCRTEFRDGLYRQSEELSEQAPGCGRVVASRYDGA
jgi:hypothetical protein